MSDTVLSFVLAVIQGLTEFLPISSSAHLLLPSLLFGLNERPTEKEIRQMAESWSPWRAVAARLLWAYYAHAKNREGIG